MTCWWFKHLHLQMRAMSQETGPAHWTKDMEGLVQAAPALQTELMRSAMVQLWPFITYNWLFLWAYTFYKWGSVSTQKTGITRAITVISCLDLLMILYFSNGNPLVNRFREYVIFSVLIVLEKFDGRCNTWGL